MFSSQARKRPGRGSTEDSRLTEPLLSEEDRTDEAKDEGHPNGQHRNARDHDDVDGSVAKWQHLIASWLFNWAGLFRSIMLRSKVLTSAILNSLHLVQKPKVAPAPEKLPPIPLTAVQEERLQRLKGRIPVPFDAELPAHQEALRELWAGAFPGREMRPEAEAEGWKEMGWQGNHPSSDFRGGGFLSLENLVYFAQKHPESFQCLMRKEKGKRAEWEYPFAAAGVNITVLLLGLLDLKSEQPCTLAGRTFLRFLQEEEHAFEELYCLFFLALDDQWLRLGASYMEFNVVLKNTQKSFEEALQRQELCSIQELPQFALLES